MKTSILVAAMLASVLSAPIVSAEEHTMPAKPAMSMDMMQMMMEQMVQSDQAMQPMQPMPHM